VTGFWIAAATITLATLALILRPLFRRPPPPDVEADHDLSVYRDQLDEIARDRAAGLLSEAEAEAARAETGRRLLAADRQAGRPAPGESRARLPAAIVIALLLPLGAAGVYLGLGNPAAPDLPLAERRNDAGMAAATARARTERLVSTLAERLRQAPDDLRGWVLLARSLTALARYREAAGAYGQAAELSGRADLLAAQGEALMAAADGQVTPGARAKFDAALAKDPTEARARYYLALAEAQAGRRQAAFDGWAALLRDAPADAPYIATLHARLSELAPALGVEVAPLLADKPIPANEGAAPGDGMTDEQRAALIDAMVARLSARLEADPADLEGWLMLGRSYMVLERPDEARDAFRRALALDPDNRAARAALDALDR